MDALPSTMRKAQYTTASAGLEKTIQIDHVPTPTKLSSGQTLVKVAYTSLNPADYKIAETIGHYLWRKPASPGVDFSGVVVKTTRTDFTPGQRVFGNIGPDKCGALAEYIVVDDGVVALPESVPFDQAACVGVAGLTAYQEIVPYGPKKVFINGGSGGTGTFGIQIAKAIGAYVVTSCSANNVQLCKDLGADEVIDYRSQDLVTELRKHEFDLIVDNVFKSVDIYLHSHEYLKAKCKYINIAGEITLSDTWNLMRAFLVPGFLGGGKRPFSMIFTKINQKELSAIGQWMDEGKLRGVIDESFDLADIRDAFAKLKQGRTRGKIVVKIGDSM